MHNNKISELRNQRGWSQEKLAEISGLSERTIQRVEKQGRFSPSTKLALANAFDLDAKELYAEQLDANDLECNDSNSLAPSDSIQCAKASNSPESNTAITYRYDWAGALGLLVLGLCIPAIILLTGTNGKWELASFALVIVLTITLTLMNYGFKATHKLFDKTSWIVRYPSYVEDLDIMIRQGRYVIRTAYGVGAMVSFVAAITLSVHQPDVFSSLSYGAALVIKPLIYALLFVEFWFRPYVNKIKKMLAAQQN
ncbi:helix-turn-helix transcriptional regulator [Thalassotalea sp. PS06]|uniref:helix-turn-helix transcriptional regulator n=1 Tax=Thalassotalea sp. PS06 TaxID=2594005 RepID=UPI001165442D|nr:helix-turn-helix transcriptional regulator [Thalassotalea sp. PS06]QDP02398.1 helix-turn-helix transcriptional regulator [Thalassotalea sp. PS06]